MSVDVFDGESEIDGDRVQRYLVLRQFVSHEGVHYQGQKLPKRVATDPVWTRSGLHSLVGSGYLYEVADDDTYSRLPAHVFTAIKSQQELDDTIFVGESPVTFNEWVEATEVAEVRAQNDAEAESRRINDEKAHERARKHQEIAVSSQVEARPVVIPHVIPAIDAMKHQAEEAAADSKSADEVERVVETENQDEHAMGTPPEHTVEVSTERDGADVTEQVHTDPAKVADTEGPDESTTSTVVPTTDDGEEARGPVRDYSDLTKAQLQDELKERHLPTSGNKDDLLERLTSANEPT